jgi:hypothetical protein
MILNGGNENSVSFKTAGITKVIIKLEFEGILSKNNLMPTTSIKRWAKRYG